MTPLRRFALAISPFLILGACSELIGLSDFEKGEPPEGEGEGGEETGGNGAGGKGGTSGNQNGGSSGAGRGGTSSGGRGGQGGTGDTGPGGESGDGGMGGEPEGGTGGMTGGSAGAGRGGTGGAGMGGAGGAGAGSGGAGTAGGGMGGSSGGGSCTTVTVPLRAAGFDSDTNAWIPYDEVSGPVLPIIVSAASQSQPITAVSSPNVAHLGGADGTNAEDYYAGQYQTFAVPVGAVTLTLTGSWQVITEETSTSTIFDSAAIQLYEDALDAGTFIATFQSYDNRLPQNGWAAFSRSVSIQDYAGQMIDLDMWAITDDSLITDFYIDSLSLTAFVCP